MHRGLSATLFAMWLGTGCGDYGSKAPDMDGSSPLDASNIAGPDAGRATSRDAGDWMSWTPGEPSGIGPADCTAEGLPVFPGAEGAGTTTVAGRGGRVLEVTTLADGFGEGTLRWALTQSFPRTVVFRVAGIIELTEELHINEPFVTVAGQTAPGDGILIAGAGLVVTAHDVLVQHLRLRPGDAGPVDPETNDAVGVLGPNESDGESNAYNVVLDHISASWSEDELLSTWYGAHHVTISNSILGEALNRGRHPKGTHSAGLLIGSRSDCVSVHHNYLVSNDFRNPLIQNGGTHEFSANVVYNWGTLPAEIGDYFHDTFINFTANHYRPGPSNPLNDGDETEMKIDMAEGENGIPRIYLADNHMPRLAAAIERALAQGTEIPFFVEERFDMPPITTTDAESLPDALLANVGAYPDRRDAVDARLVQDFHDGTGRIIDSPSDVDGYPTLAPGIPPVDSDHDGIPDEYESSHALDPTDPTDATADSNHDGHTNLEEYLNGL